MFHDFHESLWKLPRLSWKLVEAFIEASTASIEVCRSFHDFHGSLWGLVEASKAINAREHLERFRAVLLVKVARGSSPSAGQLVRKLEESSQQSERRGGVEVHTHRTPAPRYWQVLIYFTSNHPAYRDCGARPTTFVTLTKLASAQITTYVNVEFLEDKDTILR